MQFSQNIRMVFEEDCSQIALINMTESDNKV